MDLGKRLPNFVKKLPAHWRPILPLLCIVSCQLLLALEFPFFKILPKNSIVHQLPAPKTPFWCEGQIADAVDASEEKVRLIVNLVQCRTSPVEEWRGVSGKIRLSVLKPYQDFTQG